METKAEMKLRLLAKTAETILAKHEARIKELESKQTLASYEMHELGLCKGGQIAWEIIKHECLLGLEK